MFGIPQPLHAQVVTWKEADQKEGKDEGRREEGRGGGNAECWLAYSPEARAREVLVMGSLEARGIVPLWGQRWHSQHELSPRCTPARSLGPGAEHRYLKTRKSSVSSQLLPAVCQVSLVCHRAQPAAFSPACEPVN